MIKNFFLVAFRNLSKHRVHLLINVIGMGLALACCIVAYLNYKFASDFDKYHTNYKKIHKIHINKEADGNFTPYGITPLGLGPAIENDIAGVQEVVRYTAGEFIIQHDDKVLNKWVGFADANLFDVFNFPLLSGSEQALKDREHIFLSEETAIAYFGDQDPLGKILKLRDDSGTEQSYIVAGVMDKMPLNISFTFDALLLIDNYETFLDVDDPWRGLIAATFIMTEDANLVSDLPNLLEQYIPLQNKARPDWKIANFYIEPLDGLGAKARDVLSNWLRNAPPPPAVIAPMVMAFLMLLVAAFNFTNMSIALSSTRLKEIGIRKVMGGSKTQLVVQFMSENLMLVLISILIALLMANYLVPAYSALWEWQNLELDLVSNRDIYLFLFGLLIFTGLVAGTYPSMYVSSFEPVKILSRRLKVKGAGNFSKVLLSLQFGFTVIALFASVAFMQNAHYQNTLDMGYERESILGVRLKNAEDYIAYANALSSQREFLAVTGTGNHIGSWTYSNVMKTEQMESEVFMMDFSPEYFEVMDLKMAAGRAFQADLYESDLNNSVIVNETLVESMGWDEPIGQRVTIGDTVKLNVVGVVEDFYIQGLFRPIDPLAMRVADKEDYNFVIVRAETDKLAIAHAQLQSIWEEVVPNRPFQGFYQDELMKESQTVNKNIVLIFGFLGILSIALSGIGLFSLVSLTVIKRIKEIGVRKVLGARAGQIVLLINRSYLPTILLGTVFGLIGGYFLIDMLIASIFSYYQAVNWITILSPLALILLVSFVTSTSRIMTAATQNPSKSLRYE